MIHLGSLAHLLAPGLGLGYLVAPSALVDRLARLRQRLDQQGDRVLEWAVADLLRDGDLERHLARARKVYRERRDAFMEALREELGPESEAGFRFPPPEGGLACWAKLPPGLDAEAWCAACQRFGLKLHPGSRYEFLGQATSPWARAASCWGTRKPPAGSWREPGSRASVPPRCRWLWATA